MEKYLLSSVFILINWFVIIAQNTTIKGNIKQIDSITPLGGVSVHLNKTDLGAITSGNGNYIIENIPKGNYTLIVSSIGYQTIKKNISIKDNQIIKENFILIESISTLPEITITGGSIDIKNIPGSVHYISPKEIEQFNYTDINRVLLSVPGVNIQEEDGFGLFPSIGLRGTGVERNTKITVMEDGILMSPAPYAAPAAYYFPTMGRMQGIEIVKGSSQIKYGPYTTGGAINLISTQIPTDFSGKIRLWGGSFEGKNLHAIVGNKHKNFAYVVETFQQRSNGFKELSGAENRGLPRNAGFIKQDYLMKFRVNTNADAKIYQSLTFKIGQATGDINETYLGLTQEDFNTNPIKRYAGSQVDNIQTLQNQFSLTHKIKLLKSFNITTTAYRTTFARNWYKLDKVKGIAGNEIKIAKLLDNPIIYPEELDIIKGVSSTNTDALFVKANNRNYYSQGVQTKLDFKLKTNKIKHNIEVGIRIHQDQIDRFQWVDEYAMSNGLMQLTKSGIHGTESNRIETANAIASFLQHKLNYKKLTITSGIRMENITQERLDYGTEDPNRTGLNLLERKNNTTTFIPGIGFNYKFNNNTSTFLGIHKGFAPSGSKEELEPEESINYELGTRYKKNGLSGQIVLFFNNYSNLLGTDLEAADGGGTNEQFNGGAVQTKGLEFNLTYDLLFSKTKNLYSLPITLVYTYTDAKFQNSFDSDFVAWGEVQAGDNFPYLANNQFSVILGLEHQKYSLGLSGKYMDEIRTEPGQGSIPYNEKINPYFIVDFNANYNLHKNFSVFTNITNLMNQIYVVARRPAGLRPGLPRAFNLGIKANF